jgi:hypothetical protein
MGTGGAGGDIVTAEPGGVEKVGITQVPPARFKRDHDWTAAVTI